MCSINYKASSTWKVLANVPTQDRQDLSIAELSRLPIAAICGTRWSIHGTDAWSTFSPLRFYLRCTVLPNDDDDKLDRSSIRNAAPQNVGIFNMLCQCWLLQRWWTGRLCSKCKELLLRLKTWAVVLPAEIVCLLNLLITWFVSFIYIVHSNCSIN